MSSKAKNMLPRAFQLLAFENIWLLNILKTSCPKVPRSSNKQVNLLPIQNPVV
uniref:Uncharacterized protein n=1 Tax=Arundo donax TaxID=35708 RepID=A0A0A9FV30_ARUDO